MIMVRVRYADIALETDGYRCAEPGCTRHYTDGRGYFDVIDDRVLAEKFSSVVRSVVNQCMSAKLKS